MLQLMLKLNVNHFVIFTFYCNYLRIQLHQPKKKKKYSLSRMKNKSLENPRFVLSEIISSMIKFQRYRTKVKFF